MGQISSSIEGVIITPLKIIEKDQGNIMHAMKMGDEGYAGFGEAYFTFVKHKVIKGWKKHGLMTLNLIVPIGAVKFVLFDDRKDSPTQGLFFEIILSTLNYQRLTVPPKIWIAFQGIGGQENMVLNLASIMHDPAETEDLNLKEAYLQYHNWI